MAVRACQSPPSKKSGTIHWMRIMTGYKRGLNRPAAVPIFGSILRKNRPAVVVSPDYPSDDLLVVAVTSVGDGFAPGRVRFSILARGGADPSFVRKSAIASAREIWSGNNSANCANLIW